MTVFMMTYIQYFQNILYFLHEVALHFRIIFCNAYHTYCFASNHNIRLNIVPTEGMNFYNFIQAGPVTVCCSRQLYIANTAVFFLLYSEHLRILLPYL